MKSDIVQFHNPNRPGQHPPPNNFPQAPGAGYGGPVHQGMPNNNNNAQMNWQPSPAAAPPQVRYFYEHHHLEDLEQQTLTMLS